MIFEYEFWYLDVCRFNDFTNLSPISKVSIVEICSSDNLKSKISMFSRSRIMHTDLRIGTAPNSTYSRMENKQGGEIKFNWRGEIEKKLHHYQKSKCNLIVRSVAFICDGFHFIAIYWLIAGLIHAKSFNRSICSLLKSETPILVTNPSSTKPSIARQSL